MNAPDCLAVSPPLQLAWELAYLDPPAARSAALQAFDGSRPASLEAGWACWLMALADVRTAAQASARQQLQRARDIFAARADGRGLALCSEVEAIGARRDGDLARCRALHAAIDARADPGYIDFDRFLIHNSRAIAAKQAGQAEVALAHFCDALAAAEACGWDGPRITALGNLGGHHWDLFNLDDARNLSEQALAAGREAGARSMITGAAAHLIVIHHALGQPEQALSMARFLIDHPEEQLPGALQPVALPIALAFLGSCDVERAESWLASSAAAGSSDRSGPLFRAWLGARCRLARGDLAAARELAERMLGSRREGQDPLYHRMELLRVAADACEALGDPAAALAHARQVHVVYQQLAEDGSRARSRALQASHDFARVERQLEIAQRSRVESETDRRRLADLNRALEAKVAETQLLHAQLREQALRDPLTGLYNRRYLFEVGPGLLELARRQSQQLCVALIDLDHFKLLNDTCGHAAGDAVLQRFAELLLSRLRRSDVLCRYGGEEFVVVMPDIDGESAVLTMERVLEAFHAERLEFRRRRLTPITFSAGVATFPTHGDAFEALLGRADKALYAAKESGRARVEFARHSGFAALT